MVAKGNVRTHARRTKSGKTATVRQHSRVMRGRQGGGPTAGHAWRLARKAWAAGRKRRRVMAAVLGGLAVAELGAWGALRGVALIAATAGVLALGVAAVAAFSSGGWSDL